MNNQNWIMTVVFSALMTAWALAGSECALEKGATCTDEAAKATQVEHGEDDGHGHGGSTSTAPFEERASGKCEHDVPIYQCAECRYEVGVVKLDASLQKDPAGSGLVRTQAVERAKVALSLPATGEVSLNENATVHITPRIGGIIDSVSADIGTRAKAGDVLLTLSSVELGKILAEYDRNLTLSTLSEKILARETRLLDQKIGSEQDMLEAQMAHEQHRAELKASEQTLHVLGLTEEDLAGMRGTHGVSAGRLPLRAPLSGTIIEKHAVAGEMVETGRDLMVISDLTTIWVWAHIQSRDLARLLDAEKRGPVAVEITVAAFPDRRYGGILDYVGATMDEQTRTVKVRASVKNPDFELRPGMFCEAAMSLGNGQTEEVVAVPRTAVFSDEGKSFVFKHWKDDYFVRQDVSLGREFFGQVEILKGLEEGEPIVTDGAFLLKSDVLREKMGAGCAD
jgi:cobalt-zinc-cadmium efflux system membrane fusion protein